MLKFYGVYRSRVTRNVWLSLELGIPFEQVPVIQAYRLPDPNAPNSPLHTKSPAFLRVNPNGHIPTMDDDGFVLHESLAINLYLAKKHGGALSATNTQEDGLMTMWSMWALTEIETNALHILYNMSARPPEQRDAKIAAEAVIALKAPFSVLNQELKHKQYLVGNRFTVADINVAECVRYAIPAGELFDAAPNVKDWLKRCHDRPHYKAMMALRETEPA